MDRPKRRVKIDASTDLAALVEEVRADHCPRILERDGEDVAVILSSDDYAALTAEPKSRRNKEKLMALAGVWADLDAEEMIEAIYGRRHESPASHPVSFD